MFVSRKMVCSLGPIARVKGDKMEYYEYLGIPGHDLLGPYWLQIINTGLDD